MLRRLTVRAERFPLERPFRISRGIKHVAEVVTVELAEGGAVGRGECVPYPRYGETVTATIAAIEAQRSALEAGAGRSAMLSTIPAGAARNAVDCALWDLELRLAGTNIWSALCLPADCTPVATALTVGLDTPARMGEAARALSQVPLIKVKVDRSDPIAQLRAVRKAASDPRMIVDPNESWTMHEVAGLQGLLAELRIDCLEQPLPAGEDEGLRGFASSVPIAADESIHVAEDLASLPDGYTIVNVKLDKTGGLTAALQLAEAARARGLGVMTGCMISTSLSIAPALALAKVADSVLIDLDGPLWLAEDRAGGVAGIGGLLHAPRRGFWGGVPAASG